MHNQIALKQFSAIIKFNYRLSLMQSMIYAQQTDLWCEKQHKTQ